MERKVYIGDSVYAEFDGFGVILTTENGYGPSNTIVLEPKMVVQLGELLKRWHRQPGSAMAKGEQ